MIAAIIRYPLGRGGRAEYWAGFVVAVALITTSGWLESDAPRLLMWLAAVILWLVLTLRRLRDIGWWTWLTLLPVAPAVVGFGLLAAAGENNVDLTIAGALLSMCAASIWLVLLVLVGAWNPKRPPPPSAEHQARVFA